MGKVTRALVLVGTLAVAAALLGACGSSGESTATGTGGGAGGTTSGADAILSLPITDARTGETFTLADYAGTPLYVENFATWCTNCRQQLQHVQAATEQSDADVAYVSLSVETDLSADDVAAYAADQGFTGIRFAVMSPELLAAMSDRFGNSALNPPSTPHFVVTPDGTVGELVTGFEEPGKVLASLGATAG